LGLVKQDEDWIFSINIGNVMSMAPLTIEELSSNNGVKSETYHEVARDSMLEKIILIIIAYFCIATEMRFIAKELTKQYGADYLYSSPYYRDSEAFHAKSIHIGAQFLPKACPLVDYIIKSYKKNYLKDKVAKVLKPDKPDIPLITVM